MRNGSQIAATMLELYHDKVIKSNKAGPAGRPESKRKLKSNKSLTGPTGRGAVSLPNLRFQWFREAFWSYHWLKGYVIWMLNKNKRPRGPSWFPNWLLQLLWGRGKHKPQGRHHCW